MDVLDRKHIIYNQVGYLQIHLYENIKGIKKDRILFLINNNSSAMFGDLFKTTIDSREHMRTAMLTHLSTGSQAGYDMRFFIPYDWLTNTNRIDHYYPSWF